MFGMSSEQFWDDDPQLYWAYRTFYLKKIEQEQKEKLEFAKYDAWLKGNTICVAHSIALKNTFGKQAQEFPSYKEMFKDKKITNKKLTKQEVDKRVHEEFNAWARM